MLRRLAIALVAGAAVIAVLLAVLSWLVSPPDARTSATRDDSVTDVFETWFRRRSPPRTDFEPTRYGAIVPVTRASALLKQCSEEEPAGIDAYWQPTRAMIDDLEQRLPTFLQDATAE